MILESTILSWFRKLVAKKFDSSRDRRKVGRPRTPEEIEVLIVKMAEENPSWGYSRIVGALSNLGIKRCEETIAKIEDRAGDLAKADADMAFVLLRTDTRACPGPSSSGPIRTCSPQLTSSPQKC